MLKKISLPALCVIILLAGCEERVRLNPLDPQNPYTAGKAYFASLTTDRSKVVFTWNDLDIDDLLGYQIVRTNPDDIRLEWWIPVDTNELVDSGLVYDNEYSYTIQAVTSFDSSKMSDEVLVTTGPWNIWFTDYYSTRVTRLTYDGRYVMAQEYLTSPIDIAVDHDAGIAFIADYWNETVFQTSLKMDTIYSHTPSYGQPVGLEINKTFKHIYYITRADSVSYLLDLNYITNEGDGYVLPFMVSSSGGIAYDRSNERVWIIGDRDLIYSLDLNDLDNPQAHLIGNDPSFIELDQTDGTCWVGSDSNLVHILNDGTIDTIRANFKVYGLSLNLNNGDCFYSGYNFEESTWQIRKITRASGTDEVFTSDYTYVADLQVVPNRVKSGLIVFQYNYWQLLRFDADGNLLQTIADANGRIRFALE